MKRLAIITARGGSKRIPRKNIKEFCGKPILAYSIEAALKSGSFDTVMVSTDDEEIAGIAREYGAEVPFMRSEKTSNDFATTKEVVREVLDTYAAQGKEFDQFCCIYPTAPFLTASRLQEAMALLEKPGVQGAMSVVAFSFPPQRCVIIEDGCLKPKWPENMLKRSQDLEPFYHDAGQFYCLDVKSFLEQDTMVPAVTAPIILSDLEVQDIDNEDDWEMAELKFKRLHAINK